MSRSYWNTGESYSQPKTAQLQNNAKQTMQKEKSKGRVLEPVVIQGRSIVKSWRDMQIMRAGLSVGSGMCVLVRLWISRFRKEKSWREFSEEEKHHTK